MLFTLEENRFCFYLYKSKIIYIFFKYTTKLITKFKLSKVGQLFQKSLLALKFYESMNIAKITLTSPIYSVKTWWKGQ